MTPQDKALTYYVIWLCASAVFVGPLVHELGHWLGFTWLILEGPIVLQANHFTPLGLTFRMALPSLEMIPVTSFIVLMPGLMGGGLTEAVYWYFGNRFLIRGLRRQEATLFSCFVLWNASALLVYSVVEVVRNAQFPSPLWSPIWETVTTYGIGFFAAFFFRDFRETVISKVQPFLHPSLRGAA